MTAPSSRKELHLATPVFAEGAAAMDVTTAAPAANHRPFIASLASAVVMLALGLGVGLGLGLANRQTPLAAPSAPRRDAAKHEIIVNVDTGRVAFAQPFAYDPASTTAGDLLNMVGSSLGVSPQYIALFTQAEGQMVDALNRRVFRRRPQRIGCTDTCENATLLNSLLLSGPVLKIAPGAAIHCYLRPLRGDHVHVSFSVYVYGEYLDVLFDTPFLRSPDANEGNTYPVSSNLSEGLYDYHISQVQPHFGVHAGEGQHHHGVWAPRAVRTCEEGG